MVLMKIFNTISSQRLASANSVAKDGDIRGGIL